MRAACYFISTTCKVSVTDVVPTNPNTSYSTARSMQREASSEPVPPSKNKAESAGPRWSHRQEKKTQLLMGGCVSNQGLQSGAVRKATVGSDQLRLTPASESSRFPDFGCAQCSLSPAPHAHMPTCPLAHRMRAAGTQAPQPAVALPTVGSVGHGISLSRMLLQCCRGCCVWRGRRCVVAFLLVGGSTDCAPQLAICSPRTQT